MPRLSRFALPTVLLGGLAGCGDTEKFPPACPSLALLQDAADLTRYRGPGRDFTDLDTDARITRIDASCHRDTPSKVRSTIQVHVDADRGPASASRNVTVPYFVAVTENGQILDRKQYAVPAIFPSNVEHVSTVGDPIDLVVPVTGQRSAAAYKIYVGFQLTADEIAVNRQRGPR